MANQWFYTVEEVRKGPVSAEDLKQLAQAGKLSPDDFVWKEGMDDWRPASQVKGLFSEEKPEEAAKAPARRTDVKPSPPPAWWQIPRLVGALPLIAALFVPWWNFRIEAEAKDLRGVTPPLGFPRAQPKLRAQIEEKPAGRVSKEDRKKQEQFAQDVSSSFGWYLRHFTVISMRTKSSDDSVDVDGKIWGWNTTQGVSAALLGFAILPVTIVLIFWPAARKFAWVIALLTCYAGLIIGLLTLTWYIDCPGVDMKPQVSQGAHLGPYLVFTGCALLFGFGLADGVLGLRRFAQSQADSTPA